MSRLSARVLTAVLAMTGTLVCATRVSSDALHTLPLKDEPN